jgi:hypothetical protein
MPPELILPPIPPGCQSLWAAFLELNSARSSGGMSASGISFQDIAAWQSITGVTLNPWELDVICALDRVALKAAATQQDPKP